MVMIANLQYGWTFFVPDIQKTFGWDRDDGIRIDHLLLSPQAADRLEDVHVHREVRGREKPSDHVPVEGTFTF